MRPDRKKTQLKKPKELITSLIGAKGDLKQPNINQNDTKVNFKRATTN